MMNTPTTDLIELALAAEQRRAAQDDRGDRGQFIEISPAVGWPDCSRDASITPPTPARVPHQT